ncbi:MAG: YkgJ family cysteine cluster protein [Deltaproteobacteria bacterium]|nr:MAG: YkgJ family cysteine cluster protein [Deltaproteobacteria bacterium]
MFVWWQRRVNGFELVEADRRGRALVFHCTHFDPHTRRCDSYHSRPFMCRDYPRALLDQAWPDLFEGCGFRIIAADADRQRRALSDAALSDAGLSEEQQAELRRRMRLE